MALTAKQKAELERRRLEDSEVIGGVEDAMRYIASVVQRDSIWSAKYDYYSGPKEYGDEHTCITKQHDGYCYDEGA